MTNAYIEHVEEMTPMPFNDSESKASRCDEFSCTPETDRLVQETIEARGIRDPRVLSAMRRVPREAFVPAELRTQAYSDSPLPIGSGQTISQPYIVAKMTEAAAPKASDRCLEIGTGSGYQTAILSLLCQEVYSIEYVERLALLAERNLSDAGLMRPGIHLRHADGYHGWPERAPFDVILLTAAPSRIPEPLFEQLAIGGRLIVPVGRENETQQLERWTRTGESGPSAFSFDVLEDVRFVPMVGEVRRNARG